MFTTSILLEDKQQAETLGADLFQTKTFEPAEFSRFAEAEIERADPTWRRLRRAVDEMAHGQTGCLPTSEKEGLFYSL